MTNSHSIIPDPAIWNGDISTKSVIPAVEGNDVTLSCDVCMNPPGNITWSFKDQPIHSQNTSGPNITMTRLTSTQFGNYTCTGTNTINDTIYRQEFTIQLVTNGPPDSPTDLTVIGVTSNSVTLSWRAGFNGYYDNVEYNVTHVAVNSSGTSGSTYRRVSSVVEGEVVNATVMSLDNTTRYEFTVTAANQHHGISVSDPVTVHSTTKGI